MASTAESMVPKAVMISTVGTCFNPLSFSRSSMPSIFPILRSESTTSGSYVLASFKASSPEAAE